MPTRTILPFDSINRLRLTLEQNQRVREDGKREYEDEDEFFDLVLFLLEEAYINGTHDAAEQINDLVGYRALDDTFDVDRIDAVINKRLADGKNWRDRLREHFDDGAEVETIMRVLESESERDANTGSLDKARESGLGLTKTWNTMLDDRVRETHSYLEGITVGLEDRFYTSDGDSAYSPGDFTLPENNANCRCYLTYGME